MIFLNCLTSKCNKVNFDFLQMFLFSSRRTTHAQINHVISSVVRKTPVLTEEHALNCATTLNASSTAHASPNIMANFIRRKFQHLVSSFRSWRRIWKSMLYTLCMIQPVSRCSKLSVISLLKMDSFGLCSSP